MTIRLRLTAYWAAVLASLLIIAGAAVLVLFQRQQWGHLDGALMEEADTSATTIERMGPASAQSIVQHLSEERDLGPRRRVTLMSADRVIAESGDLRAQLPRLTAPAQAIISDGIDGRFRFALMPFRLAGERVWLADGVDATSIRTSILRLERNLVLLLPLILGLSVAGGYWLAGHALAPVKRLISGLAEIDPRELHRRLGIGANRDEVAKLTEAINGLLARVERASEAERRFAADAAHELRTPLTILRSGLEVALAQSRSSAEATEALAAALRETQSLCRMADELLALARFDYESTVEREPVELKTLVQEVVEAMEPLRESKALELSAALNGDLTISGNPDQIRRVIINLLDNAVKYAPEHGHVEIALSAVGRRAILRVADDGPGITPTDLPRVFDRFFRSKNSAHSGNGLGLSLCREIVRLHGGEITAANRPAGGAEFTVSIPV